MAFVLRQKQRLYLILLLLWKELQAASEAISAGSQRYRIPRIYENSTDEGRSASPTSSETESVWQQGSSAPSRSLLLNTDAGWDWPAQTQLDLTTINSAGDSKTAVSTVQEVVLMAGLVYKTITIQAADFTFGTPHTNARIKLVTQIADRQTCHLTDYSNYDVPVGTVILKPDSNPWSRNGPGLMGTTSGPLQLSLSSVTNGDKLEAVTVQGANVAGSIVFMFGDIYQLCYTPDGTFAGGDDTEYKNNVVRTKLKVLGVRSSCVLDECLNNERWECYFSYKAEKPSQCVFNLKPDGGRPNWGIQTGDVSKMTWTATYDSNTMVDMPVCGNSQPDTTILDTTGSGTTFLKLDGIADPVSLPQVKADYVGTSFTLAACYCPNYNYATGESCGTDTTLCCTRYEDYVQQFGVIYYWRIRICDLLDGTSAPANGYATCPTPYMRVLPQQKFTLRIDCPPKDGCVASQENRVKYLDPQPTNERPTWDSQHGCKTTIIESGRAIWPSPQDTRTLDGGSSQTYKAWHTKQVKLSLSLQQTMDVCYCNEACATPNNWFKVGVVESTDAFAFASKIAASAGDIKTLKYVNDSGSVTFYGGIYSGATRDPYDSNKYSGKALLNIISFDRDLRYGIGDLKKTLEDFNNYDTATPTNFQAAMDSECQREDYNPTLVEGAWTKLDTKNYIANVDSVNKFLSFSGENQDQKLMIARSGVVAICYCAVLSDQKACLDPLNWIYAGRLTIRGPVGGQEWVFPTNIVVGIDIDGWGFTAQDKLRIIPETASCSDNSNSPDGDVSFKVGCPSTSPPASGEQGCRYALITTSIDLEVLTAQSSGVYISGVATTETYSTLSFSASMQNVLNEQDIITIDADRIENNGQLVGLQNVKEKFMTYQLSGNIPFQDATSESYLVGHRVSFPVVNGVTEYQQMRIPAGFPSSGASFTFTGSQGYWTRHNKIKTPAELKGEQEKDRLKVCWGVEDGGSTLYHAQAGVVSFEHPPPMTVATINPTTRQRDAVAPVVIGFTTKASTYAAASNAEQTLMLRFLDVGSNGNLVPRYADDSIPDGAGPGQIPPDTEVTVNQKKQRDCGRLFVELWSGDTEGFPMPVGCYYSKKLRDEAVQTGLPTYFQEFFITFPVGSGLRQQTNYQIVINAAIKDFNMGDHLLDLYAMCTSETGCARPFQVFEMGAAKASNGTMPKATLSDPQFNTEGFTIQRGNADDRVLDLSEMNILQVMLRGKEENAAIQKKCILRVYMWPLTLWSLGQGNCQAECIAYHANNAKCDGPISCSTESVMGGGAKNIIRLTLPADMDDITGTTKHTVKVTGLTLPQAGYFASRVGAQITRPAPDDDRASYTTSTGMLMKKADIGQTTGRLVLSGRTGYGDAPFASDTNNQLYLRISFGATVWNNGQQDAAFVTISLPDGYTCKVPDNGQPLLTLPIFTNDLDNDGYYDNNRGFLSVDSDDGNWANSNGQVCTYTPAQYMRIYQGMVVYVKVTVDNPSAAMSKLYNKNVWTAKLSSKGANTIAPNAADMDEQNFISLAEAKVLGSEYWASNAAVLSPLEQETIQPTDFRRTTSTYTDSQFLRVFFRTTQYVGRNGYVILDAPDGFDFGASCLAQDLPDAYYAFRGPASASNSEMLNRFKAVATCTGMRVPHTATTHNRARIVVGGIIDVNKYYGYQVRVTHPAAYSTSQQSEWYIWTQDSNRYVLEGSKTTVKFNRLQSSSQTNFYHQGYGMYNDAFFSKFHVDIASMQPYSISSQYTDVLVYPFVFPATTDTSLRITAPFGYTWQADTAHFEGTIQNSTQPFPANPEFQSGDNQMVWQKLEFDADQVYGFKAKIKVPDFAPATSSDSFFVEFGYNKDDITERLMAGVIAAPPIQGFTNAVVSYGSNLMAYTKNPFEFTFEMNSVLNENQGIIIQGDQNTLGFAFACPPTTLPGSLQFPSDMTCSSFKAIDDSPVIVLKAGLTPISAGGYNFEIDANNPTRKILAPGKWTMGSYNNVVDFPQGHTPIDKAMQTEGFTINGPILSAGLVALSESQRTLTKRNDRPNKENQLIFKFSLRREPASDLPLKLRAPNGFQFDEDCSESVITEQNYVFGPNTEGLWPPEFQIWQPQNKPTACIGDGRSATITIPTGLVKRLEYVFRIGIVSNPPATPVWNKWTIDYNGESSDPFPSFTVWTFTFTAVTPVSFAKSPTGANVAKTINPVKMTFQPLNRIPFKCPSCATGGMIRVTAPSRFEFVQTSGECNALLFDTAQGSENAFPAANLRCSVSPTLLTKLWLEIVSGDTNVESGRDYTLIVYVYNPSVTDQAQEWGLDSFDTKASANVNQDQIALDESVILGHPIHNVLNTWTVVNKFQSQNGKAFVSDVDITMQFPDSLKDDDLIKIWSPFEYDIMGDVDLGNCKDFRWPANTRPLPGTRNPSCECASSQCEMSFTITESKDPAYPQNQNLQFTIATVNPTKTPFVTKNFWRVEHLRNGLIKSSHVYPSWSINPQLENVQINLVGANQAAGTESDLVFSFMPVSDAGTIKIEALFPTEFDFGRATVPVPYDIDDRRDRGTIIVNRAGVNAGRLAEIKISSVQLGRGGGQTRFNIITYKDEALTEKMDEKLEYIGGFRLPGVVTTSSQDLQSRYKAERQLFPVRSLFQARVNELAKAEFVLMFSQPATASQKLVITCLGQGSYELQTSPFVVIGKERIDTSVALTPGMTTELQATLKPGRPATEVALEADTPYTVIFNVIPAQGTNNWKFQTVDGGEYPTNTNDGVTPGFSPVEQMTLSVSTPRSPPFAEIDVVLNVDQGSAVVLELLVIAPPNFIFPSTGCGDLCQAGQALGATMRRTATIASKTGEPLTALTGLQIKVITPEQTPGGAEFWFVEARGQGRGTTTGWAAGAGFRVMQMVSGVSYAGVSSLRSAVMTFHFTIELDAGSEIAIEPPTNYILTCSTEALQVGSLPGPGRPGCTDEPLVLMLASSLKRDIAYSFAIGVDLPAETPTPNTFNMIIRDSDNTVVDAVYGLAGVPLQAVPVTSPTLSWSSAEPAQKADITIGITFTSDYNKVKALLITLPNTFLHEVMTPTQVQNLNRRFPVAASQAGGWAKTNDQDRIKIELDDSDDSTVIAADTYSWSFPVLVPANFDADIPRINVWYFSLCDSRTCREPNGNDVIVSFPIQGFARGEVSPISAKNPTDSAHVSSFSFSTFLAIVTMAFCSA